MLVTCPSGLTGEVRGFKIKEANFLADRVAMRSGAAFDSILSGCWVRTVDPGPYEIPEGRSPNWSKVLVADRFEAMLAMRSATFGDAYSFFIPQCESCGERFEWEVKLADLPRKPLPEATKAALREGNRFPAMLSNGTQVFFRLQTGEGEAEAAKLIKSAGSTLMVTALFSRILEVEGVTKFELRRFLGDLDMSEMMLLMDQFDAVDGGVETTIDVECPHCGRQQRVDLPLGRDFFLPKVKAKATTLR